MRILVLAISLLFLIGCGGSGSGDSNIIFKKKYNGNDKKFIALEDCKAAGGNSISMSNAWDNEPAMVTCTKELTEEDLELTETIVTGIYEDEPYNMP